MRHSSPKTMWSTQKNTTSHDPLLRSIPSHSDKLLIILVRNEGNKNAFQCKDSNSEIFKHWTLFQCICSETGDGETTASFGVTPSANQMQWCLSSPRMGIQQTQPQWKWAHGSTFVSKSYSHHGGGKSSPDAEPRDLAAGFKGGASNTVWTLKLGDPAISGWDPILVLRLCVSFL